jgi:FkbM family methyltransferase
MSDSETAGFWYAIDGWNGPQPSQICLTSRTELDLMNRIIADEVSQFDHRLDELEKRLSITSPMLDEFQRSKSRPLFQPVVETLGSRPKRVGIPPLEPGLLANVSPLRPEFVGMSGIEWLSFRFPSGGPVLQIGSFGWTLSKEMEAKSFHPAVLAAGEGEILPSGSGIPDRGRPDSNSFAAWLAAADIRSIGSVSFFSFGGGTADIDVRLLQWSLLPHHVVVLAKDAASLELMLTQWDGNAYELSDCYLFTDPGPRFLDPSAGGGSNIPPNVWPKVSVVTVSYNQGKYIEDCLNSVLSQDYPNLEYIVVDAVSSDGTVDILRRYEHRLARLIIEKDQGQSAGLNKGFRLATGDLFTWINSDDMLAPGALKRAALYFMQYGCDIVAGGCERITENSDDVFALHHPALPYMRNVPLGLAQNLVWHSSWEKGDYFFQPEVIFTANIWRDSGGFLKEHLYWAMDWELWLRMGMAGATIVHVPARIGRSRSHPDQKTTSEELYLYQLKNILLEFSDAIAVVEKTAIMLPEGEPYSWPVAQATRAPSGAPLSFAQRILRLRDPVQLKLAIRNRMTTRQVEQIRGVRQRWRGMRGVRRGNVVAARSRHLINALACAEKEAREARALADRLQVENQTLQQLVTEVREMQQTYFRNRIEGEKSNEAIVDRAKRATAEFAASLKSLQKGYDSSLNACRERYEQSLKIMRGEYEASLQALQEGLIPLEAHHDALRAMRAEYERSTEAMSDDFQASLQNSRAASLEPNSGVAIVDPDIRRSESAAERARTATWFNSLDEDSRQHVADYVARFASLMLFARSSTEKASEQAYEQLRQGASLFDISRATAAANPSLHTSEQYRSIRGFFARDFDFELRDEFRNEGRPFTIVDVGAETLTFEDHVYAQLVRNWPSFLVGFDPFLEPQDENGKLQRREINGAAHNAVMLPSIVANGESATFHINRFRPTSSLFAANTTVTDAFGLLSKSLETEETMTVETQRLDDLCANAEWAKYGIDFLKIDVQGGTFDVVANAPQILERTLVCHLETEFAEIYRGETLFGGIDAEMRQKGFGLLDFYNPGHTIYASMDTSSESIFHTGRLLWADSIYIRSLDKLDGLSDEDLRRLAVMLHEIYRKYDVSAECLRILDDRNRTSLLERYLRSLR